jgi:hypothetical protein
MQFRCYVYAWTIFLDVRLVEVIPLIYSLKFARDQ